MMHETHRHGVDSTAAIRRHPIHPMLVPFPIAFLATAPLTDIGFLLSDDLFWARASMWLIGAGLVTGLVAAGIGLTDFLTISRARVTVGWAHLLGNLAVMALALWNLLLRADDPVLAIMPLGLVLSLVCAAGPGGTGWLGGELAYRHKIGVIEEPAADV